MISLSYWWWFLIWYSLWKLAFDKTKWQQIEYISGSISLIVIVIIIMIVIFIELGFGLILVTRTKHVYMVNDKMMMIHNLLYIYKVWNWLLNWIGYFFFLFHFFRSFFYNTQKFESSCLRTLQLNSLTIFTLKLSLMKQYTIGLRKLFAMASQWHRKNIAFCHRRPESVGGKMGASNQYNTLNIWSGSQQRMNRTTTTASILTTW